MTNWDKFEATETKIFIAGLWLLSFGYTIYFLSVFIPILNSGWMAVNHPSLAEGAFLPDNFETLAKLNMAFAGVNLILLVYFLNNLYHNKKIGKAKRPMWTILLIIGNILVMPFYYIKYIL